MCPPGRFARWSYRGGRPSRLTNLLNGGWAFLHGLGVLPDFLVTLEVRGRRSGRVYANPMVVAPFEGESYLVSMLGERAPWVQNVRAADGHVTIKRGTREAVRLEEVLVGERPRVALFERAASEAGDALEEPPADVHGSAEYRRSLAKTLTRRALAEAVSRAGDAR